MKKIALKLASALLPCLLALIAATRCWRAQIYESYFFALMVPPAILSGVCLILRGSAIPKVEAEVIHNMHEANKILRDALRTRGLLSGGANAFECGQSVVEIVGNPVFAVALISFAVMLHLANLEITQISCSTLSISQWTGLATEWILWIVSYDSVFFLLFNRNGWLK